MNVKMCLSLIALFILPNLLFAGGLQIEWVRQAVTSDSPTLVPKWSVSGNGDSLKVVGNFKDKVVLNKGRSDETTLIAKKNIYYFSPLFAEFDISGNLVQSKIFGSQYDIEFDSINEMRVSFLNDGSFFVP